MTTNAAVFIATNYPNFDQRAGIEELDLANKGLKGELHFAELGFTNLKKIDLANNSLTSLVLTNPQNIEYLKINNNQISSLQVPNGLVENELKNANYFEFINNPLSLKFKQNLLKSRWNYWKQVEKHYSEILSPQIMKLVDSSDLDDFVANYDFSKEGDIAYHKILGNYNQLDEIGLQQLAQQLLARCLIKQNQLINGSDEKYEEEINNYAKQFQKTSSFYIQYTLNLIQRSVDKKIRGSKDLEKEFQNKLLELEALLNPARTPNYFDRAVDFEEVKKKIWELQETITGQQEEIVQLKRDLRDKETARRSLAENYQASEVEKAEIRNTATDLKKTNQELFTQLQLAEDNALKLRQVNKGLNDNNHNLSTIQTNLNKVLQDKEEHITQLKNTTDQLAKEKKAVEEQLQQLLVQEQERKDYWKKVKNWGIAGVILIVIAGLVWGYIKFKHIF